MITQKDLLTEYKHDTGNNASIDGDLVIYEFKCDSCRETQCEEIEFEVPEFYKWILEKYLDLRNKTS